jgi:hypothetical protein
MRRSVTSRTDAETLRDLLDDASAIPASTYGRTTDQPPQSSTATSATITIPPASVALVEAADHLWS